MQVRFEIRHEGDVLVRTAARVILSGMGPEGPPKPIDMVLQHAGARLDGDAPAGLVLSYAARRGIAQADAWRPTGITVGFGCDVAWLARPEVIEARRTVWLAPADADDVALRDVDEMRIWDLVTGHQIDILAERAFTRREAAA